MFVRAITRLNLADFEKGRVTTLPQTHQDAPFQLCSRIAQRLNVPQRLRIASSLAAPRWWPF
jgi:hypothetical protein